MNTSEIILKQILDRLEKEIIKAYARVETLEFMHSYIESHYDLCKEENQKKNEVNDDRRIKTNLLRSVESLSAR